MMTSNSKRFSKQFHDYVKTNFRSTLFVLVANKYDENCLFWLLPYEIMINIAKYVYFSPFKINDSLIVSFNKKRNDWAMYNVNYHYYKCAIKSNQLILNWSPEMK